MIRVRLASLLGPVLLVGCFGTEVGNPDLVAKPKRLHLETACPGATRRASVLLVNRTEHPIDAAVGGTAGEEAYPSALEIEGHGSEEVILVIRMPKEAVSRASGTVQVHHRRARTWGEERLLEIPWSAPIRAGGPEATVLCGEAIDCLVADFGPVFVDATWGLPLEVANDGCAPLLLEQVEAEGAEVSGPALPATVEPGSAWSGQLLIRPTAPGELQGKVTIRTGGDAAGFRQIPWKATVRP